MKNGQNNVTFPPDRAYYLNSFERHMNSLRNQLIGFGLFGVLFVLVSQFQIESVSQGSGTEQRDHVWLIGISMLMIAVAFATYDMIAGQLYVRNDPEAKRDVVGKVTPWRVLGLIFSEIVVRVINVIIIVYPSIYISTKEVHGYEAEHILLLTSMWHTFNMVWYRFAPISRIDFIRHGSYASANLIAFLVLEKMRHVGFFGDVKLDWTVIAVYFIFVCTIFLIQVRGYILKNVEEAAEAVDLNKNMHQFMQRATTDRLIPKDSTERLVSKIGLKLNGWNTADQIVTLATIGFFLWFYLITIF